MVQAADHWDRDDGTLLGRLDRAGQRRVAFQGQMRPRAVVVVQVIRQDAPQMPLAQHDAVIQTFPANMARLVRVRNFVN